MLGEAFSSKAAVSPKAAPNSPLATNRYKKLMVIRTQVRTVKLGVSPSSCDYQNVINAFALVLPDPKPVLPSAYVCNCVNAVVIPSRSCCQNRLELCHVRVQPVAIVGVAIIALLHERQDAIVAEADAIAFAGKA